MYVPHEARQYSVYDEWDARSPVDPTAGCTIIVVDDHGDYDTTATTTSFIVSSSVFYI